MVFAGLIGALAQRLIMISSLKKMDSAIGHPVDEAVFLSDAPSRTDAELAKAGR